MVWCAGCKFFDSKSTKSYIVDDLEWFGECTFHKSLVEAHSSCDEFEIKK